LRWLLSGPARISGLKRGGTRIAYIGLFFVFERVFSLARKSLPAGGTKFPKAKAVNGKKLPLAV